jgi:hypothetical protein
VKAIEYFERLGQQWTAYVLWCFNAPYSAPVCQPFWMWVAIGAATVGGVGLAWIAWKYMGYRAKCREALRAQAALEDVADIQTIDSGRWNGLMTRTMTSTALSNLNCPSSRLEHC